MNIVKQISNRDNNSKYICNKIFSRTLILLSLVSYIFFAEIIKHIKLENKNQKVIYAMLIISPIFYLLCVISYCIIVYKKNIYEFREYYWIYYYTTYVESLCPPFRLFKSRVLSYLFVSIILLLIPSFGFICSNIIYGFVEFGNYNISKISNLYIIITSIIYIPAILYFIIYPLLYSLIGLFKMCFYNKNNKYIKYKVNYGGLLRPEQETIKI